MRLRRFQERRSRCRGVSESQVLSRKPRLLSVSGREERSRRFMALFYPSVKGFAALSFTRRHRQEYPAEK